MRRLKAFVVLVSVAGALTVLVPPAAAGPVSAVVHPPNPFITGPGEVIFEPGSILQAHRRARVSGALSRRPARSRIASDVEDVVERELPA
jgi:hypothetical protein